MPAIPLIAGTKHLGLPLYNLLCSYCEILHSPEENGREICGIKQFKIVANAEIDHFPGYFIVWEFQVFIGAANGVHLFWGLVNHIFYLCVLSYPRLFKDIKEW